MLFDLRTQKEGWASEAPDPNARGALRGSDKSQYERARGTGGRRQRFLDEEPPCVRGDDFYMRAFWELSSERQFGHAIGPIPWSKIVFYGERQKLDDSMVLVFEHVIRELDEAYLKYQRDEQKKRTQK